MKLKRPSKILRKLWLLIFIVIVLPYVYSRIMSNQNAVEIHQLELTHPIQYNQKLSIATYNIAHGRGAKLGERNWKGGNKQQRVHRLENIGKYLSKNNLDIVVLNEVDFSATWSYNINQADVIAQAGGYPYVATQRNIDIYTPVAQLRSGNAIISRYPISSAELRRFKARSTVENMVAGNHDSLIATIALNNKKKIKVWGVHLEFRDEMTRLKAAEIILEEQQKNNDAIILAGDFNSQPVAHEGRYSAISKLMNSGYYQSYPASKSATTLTFPTEKPDRTLDWIFVPKQYQIFSGHVLKAKYSDHLPIAVQVKLPK